MTLNYPKNFKYTKDHEWVSIDQGVGTVGVTKYAIAQLGDVVYLELPKVGAHFGAGETFGTIESTKTVSDLFLPVSGEIIAINEGMKEFPEKLTEDSYDLGWLVKVKIQNEPQGLLSATEYEDYIKSH